MTSYRRHGRTPLTCEVKVEHHSLGEVLAEVIDISETGLFIKCRSLVDKISVGDNLVAKICHDIHDNQKIWKSPSLLRVVRLTDEGVALTYP